MLHCDTFSLPLLPWTFNSNFHFYFY